MPKPPKLRSPDTDTLKQSKCIIWVAPPPPRKRRGLSAREAAGVKAAAKVCPACGKKVASGELARHPCQALVAGTRVRVRKLSSLPRKQRYVKVKSLFQEKLSDRSGGWY